MASSSRAKEQKKSDAEEEKKALEAQQAKLDAECAALETRLGHLEKLSNGFLEKAAPDDEDEDKRAEREALCVAVRAVRDSLGQHSIAEEMKKTARLVADAVIRKKTVADQRGRSRRSWMALKNKAIDLSNEGARTSRETNAYIVPYFLLALAASETGVLTLIFSALVPRMSQHLDKIEYLKELIYTLLTDPEKIVIPRTATAAGPSAEDVACAMQVQQPPPARSGGGDSTQRTHTAAAAATAAATKRSREFPLAGGRGPGPAVTGGSAPSRGAVDAPGGSGSALGPVGSLSPNPAAYKQPRTSPVGGPGYSTLAFSYRAY